MKLQNKVTVITGGNSGIGLAIAAEFSGQGAHVAIVGRTQDRLDEAVRSLGNGTLALKGDVSRIDDLDSLYSEVQRKLGGIDVLVVNAGVALPAPLEAADEAHFDQVSDVNFKGAYFTVQRALPFLNDGASIVLITSGANQIGFVNFSVYAATKAAVRSLARTFSAELAPRGIRVNALSPGPIATPIFDKMGLPQEQVDAFGKQISAQVPLGRFGAPEEMAKAALFLASSDSSYVVGAELVADGGMTQI